MVDLLQYDVYHFLVTTFYLCERDSDKHCGFDQSNISDYNYQYVEKLEL